MLTRTALAVLAAGAVAAGGSTATFVATERPAPPRAERAATTPSRSAADADATATRSSAAAEKAAEPADVQLPPCPADVANHGEYVSSVARGEPTTESETANHRALVSAAARSDCGKPADGDADEADDADEAAKVRPERPAAADRNAAKAARKADAAAAREARGTGRADRTNPGRARTR